MAKELFNLFGIISIKGTDKVVNNINKIEKDVKKTQRQIAYFGRSVGRIGQNLTKSLTVPIGIATGAVVKFGADFKDAMVKSTAIMGDLSDDMLKDMEKAARDVAKTSTHFAKEAAEAYFYLASAGLDASKSLEALPIVAKFAQAGTFDLALATDLLTDAQSALGLSVEDTTQYMENMTRVGNVLVKANTVANAKVSEFAEALTTKAGAALRLLNKSVEEGAAVLAVYADQGVKSALAGNTLNIVLRDLQTASIRNRKEFDAAGVSIFDSSGKMRHMADIVRELENRLSTMSDEQKRAELLTLGFTDRSVSATMALLGTSDAIEKHYNSFVNVGNIMDEVANKQLQSFSAQLKLLQNNFIDIAIDLSTILLPILKDHFIPFVGKVSKAIGKLSDWFINLSPAMRKTVIQWTLLAAAIGPVMLIAGKLIVAFKILVPLIALLTKGTAGLFLLFRMHPIGLVITAITALVAAGVYLYNNWSDLGKRFKKVWGFIVHYGMQAASHIKETFIKIQASYWSLMAGLTQKIPILGKAIQGLADKKWEQVKAEKQLRTERKKAYDLQKIKIDADKKEIEAIEKAKAATKEKTEESVKSIKTISKAEKELAEQREALNKDWEKKYLDSVQSREQIILREKAVALEEAEKIGAETVNIKKYYDEQLLQAQIEHNDLMAELDEQELEKIREKKEKEKEIQQEKYESFVSAYRATVDVMSTLTNAFFGRSISNIEKKKKKDIEAIKASALSEEEKAQKISEIEKKAGKETLERKRKEAIAEKAYTLFRIGLNTAIAITNVLATAKTVAGRIVQTAAVSAAGAAQAVAVMAKPMPFFKGAFIKGSQEGTLGQIGEKGQDELVFPLEKGVKLLAEKLMAKISDMREVTSEVTNNENITYNLHVGTLVADEGGLRQLEEDIRKYRFQVDQRRGL